jgi:hypothetical protein
MEHIWGTGRIYAEYQPENLKERDQLVDLGVDEKLKLKCIYFEERE